jgi:hypothetical protein
MVNMFAWLPALAVELIDHHSDETMMLLPAQEASRRIGGPHHDEAPLKKCQNSETQPR